MTVRFFNGMIRVSKVGFFREQVSYFEGFILKIAKKNKLYVIQFSRRYLSQLCFNFQTLYHSFHINCSYFHEKS
mgnify:CR=1 FL=1